MYDTAVEARAETPIDRAIVDLEGNVQRLSGNINRLRERLDRIMCPEKPEPSEGDDLRAVRSSSEITDRLVQFSRDLSRDVDRLGNMLERLEL